ncbi:MAG TPA: LPS assembly protein LptD [Verrucomicrobiae bacterium]|nr:LPS assembly protein LptD [Verrucomicrobiae bacterium]
MRRGGKPLLLVVALLSLAAGGYADEPATNAPAEDLGPPSTVDAENMQFDQASKTYIADGHVVIHDKDAVLQADHVKYNAVTKEAWAEGHVRLNRAAQEWVSPSLYYNFDTRALKTQQAEGFVDPVYVHTENLEQTNADHYVFTRGFATTCDYDKPDYRFQATHGEIWPGDRVVLYNATLRLGDTPVGWFPMIVFSLKGDMPPIMVSVGDDSRWGAFLLSAYTWKPTKNVEVTVHADERTERGFGTGADVQYRMGPDGHGLLTGYYLNDAKPFAGGDRFEESDITHNRYRGEWQHKQYLTNDVTVTVDLNKLSDSAVMQDFFRKEFNHDRDPGSVADITKRGSDYTLSLLTTPEFNDFFAGVERLPEGKLAVDRTRLGGTPFFYEGESSVGQYHNVPGNTNVLGSTADTNFVGNAVRADTFHQIVMPEMLGGWLSVIPRAGVRGDYYSRAPADAPDQEDVTRVVYDLGTQASFKISREWDDVHSDWLHIDGLRHILQPFADYQWIPTPNVATNNLFQFDSVRDVTLRGGDLLSVTRYSPLESPAYNTIDSIDGQNLVRFGLRQALQTRRDGEAWNLVDVTGWTDWHIEKDTGETDFADFFGTMELRPYRWLSLDAFSRYDMEAGLLREFNTEMRVINADHWIFGIGTRYLRDDSNLITGDFTYQLTRHWSAHVYERFDMEDGTWEEQSYSLRQETHDWLIDYGFRDLGRHKEVGVSTTKAEMAVFVSVTLKAFPTSTLKFN